MKTGADGPVPGGGAGAPSHKFAGLGKLGPRGMAAQQKAVTGALALEVQLGLVTDAERGRGSGPAPPESAETARRGGRA